MGNIATSTDGNGKVTTYAYDNWNRLVTVTDAKNQKVQYTYDNNGNMLTQTDAKGNVTSYTYNNMNQPTKRTQPGGVYESYTYNLNGTRASMTDKAGTTTVYTYNIHGRVLTEKTGSETVTYTYDNNGNVLTATNAEGTITRSYDALNRVISKTVTGLGTTTFAYDITAGLTAGYVAESTTIDGVVTRRIYDSALRLVGVQENGSTVSSYTYYANGSLQSQTMPGNITANYTYYKNNQLKTLQNKVGTKTLEAYSYAYDGAGNMTAKADFKGTTVYTYTVLGQLETVIEPSYRETIYTYDAAGNPPVKPPSIMLHPCANNSIHNIILCQLACSKHPLTKAFQAKPHAR